MSDKFRLMMDSKAKTKKEIAQELKRMIELKARPAENSAEREDISAAIRKTVRDRISRIVREVVEEAMQDQSAGSRGEKIPPREPRDNVEYIKGSGTIEPDELAYAPSEFEDDFEGGAVRARIAEMRKLSQRFYNGYMLRQCAEETLVKQGEYVKDVTDDFGRNCFCGIDRPIYGALSTDQLRTYFTWRTLARKGIYGKTDKPYILLYCYELLNRIGVTSAADAYERLADVWEGCHGFCPSLDSLIPRWLKDFRAYNELGDNVLPASAENPSGITAGSDVEDILARRYSRKLDYMAQRSSYNLKGSIFYSESTRPMLEGALEAALISLDGYFAEKGVTMFELICGRLCKDHSWTPFAGAYVDLDRMDGFHALKISPLEQYGIKRGQPCLETFEQAPYYHFIGWVLKSAESVLRKRTGFRYGISANITPVLEDMTNRDKLYSAVNAPEFSELVKTAVEQWCDLHGIFPPQKRKKRSAYNYDEAPQNEPAAVRKPVEIDVGKLAKIRQEADETTRKLIVEEPDDAACESITERAAEIEEDSFGEQTAELAENYSEYNSENIIPCAFDGLADGWREFAKGMSAEDISLLKALLDGNAEEQCRSRAVMPETEYDRINAAAMENIGDILIENGAIIEDYIRDIENIVSLA